MKKIVVLGVIALALASGLALASCDAWKCSEGGSCYRNLSEFINSGGKSGYTDCDEYCINRQYIDSNSSDKNFNCDCN